jgi:hypothetical protein
MKTITITDNPKVKTSELISDLKKKFDVYCYWDDKRLNKEFPVPKKSTTRRFALEAESSAMKGSSWNEMASIRDSLMTFREYILYFEAYHKETGQYPDEKGWTFFRDHLSDGSVAGGDWRPVSRGVRFNWYYPGRRNSSGGARVAISLNSLDSLVPLDKVEDGRILVLEKRIENIEKWIRNVKDQLL